MSKHRKFSKIRRKARGRAYPYSSVRQDVRNRMRYLPREKLSEIDYRIAASVLGRKRLATRYP